MACQLYQLINKVLEHLVCEWEEPLKIGKVKQRPFQDIPPTICYSEIIVEQVSTTSLTVNKKNQYGQPSAGI